MEDDDRPRGEPAIGCVLLIAALTIAFVGAVVLWQLVTQRV